MHALILAGGKGSRLRPFSFTIPKPLVPIGEHPIIEILIRQLAAQGFLRITVSVGYLAELVRAFCGDGSKWGVVLDYVAEDAPLGTMGCLGLIDHFDDDRILVVNGDTLTDLDMSRAYLSHDVATAMTIYAHRRVVDIDFGVLEVSAGLLTAYVEKPSLPYRVSMGINVVSTWVVAERIAPNEPKDLPGLAQELLAEGGRIRVVETDAYWLDLGRFDDLERGAQDFARDPERFLPA